MNEQLDLTGGAHTITQHGALTPRQQAALDHVRAHAPVPTDELGAAVHAWAHRNGQRGHALDARCDWCGHTGRQVGASLRAKGLVKHSRVHDGWIPTGWKPAGVGPGELPEGF